ncbi:MAG: hypothetical protein M3252_09025 [Actinomycetota bacterium]|nr:hypothetical protein [Actinomycetota bacterium]
MKADVKDLYAGPLEEFVERRNALSRALRAAGEREAADEVRALRKPSVAAWALNQLVRRRAREVERFLTVADRLRDVQRRALDSDTSRWELRATSSDYRDAMEELGRHAAAILEEVGSSAGAHRAEVTASLQAAAVDDEARRQLRAGTLARPFPAPGLVALTANLPATVGVEPVPNDPQRAVPGSPRGQEGAARAALDQARRRRRQAQQRLRVAGETAERLNQRVTSLEKRARRLAQDAADAAQEAREARQRADEATEVVRRAQSEFDEAERMLEEAERSAARAR